MDLEKAYIYVQADGYVPIRSEPFRWPAVEATVPDPGSVSARIDFRQGTSVPLTANEDAALAVTLRRPEPRYVTLVGDRGEALSGERLSANMFWSRSNHCGVLAGADPLGEFVSDSAGRIALPDGDYEYALVLRDSRSVFRSPPQREEPTLLSYLPKPDTTLHVHRFVRRPLRVHVLSHGRPVSHAVLNGRVANCGCGACEGPIAVSDTEGRMAVDEFYPEDIGVLFICNEDRKPVWQLAPSDLPAGTLVIDLGPDYSVQPPGTPCYPPHLRPSGPAGGGRERGARAGGGENPAAPVARP
ncbi:MAG: hypothetical protein HY825_00295 [Acidobacteria bacterium]|nr:hypothetical protein [Acidobacteriota bacterium]